MCLADDIEAPHALQLSLENPTLGDVADALRAQRHLPSVMGGATWIWQGGDAAQAQALAVLAQNGETRFLVDAGQSAWNYVARAGESHFYLIYWCQVEAARVFEALQSGAPLPDKYGR